MNFEQLYRREITRSMPFRHIYYSNDCDLFQSSRYKCLVLLFTPIRKFAVFIVCLYHAYHRNFATLTTVGMWSSEAQKSNFNTEKMLKKAVFKGKLVGV